MSAPRCVFCGRSEGAQFQIFGPRFEPFGTACVECERTLPPGTEVPEPGMVRIYPGADYSDQGGA